MQFFDLDGLFGFGNVSGDGRCLYDVADTVHGCAEKRPLSEIIASEFRDIHGDASSNVCDFVHKDTRCAGVLVASYCHTHNAEFLRVKH